MTSNVPTNFPQIMPRVIGDTRPIDAQLLDNVGMPLNLTNRAAHFRLVNLQTSQVKVSNGVVQIVDATNGFVRYLPTSADMNTIGEYAAYFIVTESGEPDIRAPYDGPTFTLNIITESGM